MKNFLKVALLLWGMSFCGVAFTQEVDKSDNPGSLWPGQFKSPFHDRTARRAGDLLTIIISESNVANLTAAMSASKKDSTAVRQTLFIDILDRIFKPWSTSSDSSNEGKGKSEQTGRMTGRMTVVVKQSMPNGNLVIEGTRTLVTNHETQLFRLSGVVRQDDIASDNTVPSEKIAEAEIRMEGKGVVLDRQRRGLLTRILDWLF